MRDARRTINFTAVSETTIHGWPSIALGLLPASLGTFVVLASLNVIRTPDEGFHAPSIVVALFGGLFVLVGTLFAIHGVVGLWRQRRKHRLLAREARAPWLADHPWRPEGIRALYESRWRRGVWGLISSVLFLAPFNALVLYAELPKRAAWAWTIALLDIVFVGGSAAFLVYLLVRRVKYGPGSLRFDRFPYVLGEAFAATLPIRRGAAQLGPITVTLRCVQERYEGHKVAIDELWSASATIPPRGPDQSDQTQTPIAFDLPAEARYATALSERPARYWALEAKAAAPGLDYRVRFLIPVYARPD